jgi:16S rRNA processing protein RimM
LSDLTPSKNPESETELPELDFITIGRIIAPWGVQGKVKVQIETDFPQRFSPGQQVFIDGRPLTILDISWHRNRPILKLGTIDHAEEAKQLRDKKIEIPRSQLHPLPKDHYYHFQLIGLEVRTTDGERLGKITEIITGESNDVYVVDTARGQVLIPAIADVVRSVNLERGYMEIELITGLLELNRKKSG